MMERADSQSKEQEMRCAIIMLELQRSLHPSHRDMDATHATIDTRPRPASLDRLQDEVSENEASSLASGERVINGTLPFFSRSKDHHSVLRSARDEGRTKTAGNSETPSFEKTVWASRESTSAGRRWPAGSWGQSSSGGTERKVCRVLTSHRVCRQRNISQF